MKKIITLYIDDALKDRAKQLGINLSGFLERKLQECIAINDPHAESVSGSRVA
jgi:post-segregation antitoxin (ccd killing protein)